MIQPFSTAMQTELNKRNVRLVYFVELDLDNDSYFHSGVGIINHDGKTYYGSGSLGGIGSLKQSGDIESHQVPLSLTGLDKHLVNIIKSQSIVGSEARILMGAMTEDGKHVKVMDRMFSGFVTETALSSGRDNTVTLTVASKMDKWANGKSDRYSDVNHRERNGNDHFFKFLAATSTAQIRWGNTMTSQRFRY